MDAADPILMQPDYYIQNTIPLVLGTRPYRRASQLHFQDFMQCTGDMTPQQLVNESVRPEHWLGMGRFTEVYAIPGTSRYVLKLERSIYDEDYFTHKPMILSSNDTDYEMEEIQLPQINLGQAVARVGYAVTIARRVWGQPFMWLEHGKFSRESIPTIYDSNVASMQLAASLHQSAYDHLAVQVGIVQDARLSWEPHSENLMLTPSAGGFGLVDVERNQSMEGGRRLSSLVHPFVGDFPTIDVVLAEPCRQQMLRKAVRAAIRAKFDFQEQNSGGLLWGFIQMGLDSCGLREWFLAHLQENEEAGRILAGSHEHWQQVLSM